MVFLRTMAAIMALGLTRVVAPAGANCPSVGDVLPPLNEGTTGAEGALDQAQAVLVVALFGCIIDGVAETRPFTALNSVEPAPGTIPAPGIVETVATAPPFTAVNLLEPEPGTIPAAGIAESFTAAPPVTAINALEPTELPDPGILEAFLSVVVLAQNNTMMGMGALSCAVDSDSDGLANCHEILLGLDMRLADSDGDGVLDGDEDTDGDGLANVLELAVGTYPYAADSDGDGFSDLVELERASDPMSAGSRPAATPTLAYASAPPLHLHNRAGAGDLPGAGSERSP